MTTPQTRPSGPPAARPASPGPAPSTAGPTGARERALVGVDALSALLSRCNRADLTARVAAARRRLEQTTCTVLVVGEFKKGKSSLINALVNAPICPVDDDAATAKPIEVHYSATPEASVVLRAVSPTERTEDMAPATRPLDFDDISAYAAEPTTAPDADQVAAIRLGLPRQLLATGLVLVDTPGVGGLASTHSAVTVSVLPSADAVLFVTDASQELTASELEFLRTAVAMCPTVTCILTKIDFYPAWRKIRDLDAEHLSRAGVDATIVATSAPLRAAAIERNDRALNDESGYGDLVTFLRDELVGRVQRATLARLDSDLREVADHLESQLRAELSVLYDPEESARLVRQLEAAKEQAERLRSQAARWQQTLNDGTADLVADVEHDLRARLRELVREADEAVEKMDPAKAWDEFEPWLTQRSTSDVVANYTILQQRSVQLASAVAAHFEQDHREISARLDLVEPNQVPIDPEVRPSLKLDRTRPISQAVSAMRGTSGGMLMLTAFAGITGVALAAPFLATVGLLLGRKALKDERSRQLLQRRNLARQTVRKYADDLAFGVGKDSRDTLRRINRQLRDHFLQRAEELTSSTSESLAAAQQAVRSSEAARTERRREVVALLEQLANVRKRLAAATAPARAPAPAKTPVAATGAAPAKAPADVPARP